MGVEPKELTSQGLPFSRLQSRNEMEKAFQKLCDSCKSRMPNPLSGCYKVNAVEEYRNRLCGPSTISHRWARGSASAKHSSLAERMLADVEIRALQDSLKHAIDMELHYRRIARYYKQALAEATQGSQDSMLREMANVERHMSGSTGCVCTPPNEYGQKEDGASTSSQL